MPVLLEWYKHVAVLCVDMASVPVGHPGHLDRDPVHLGVLRGLLHRCSRLMHSTLKLAQDPQCGGTVALLARCIAESALNTQWLVQQVDNDRFTRFIGHAVKADLTLRDPVEANVAERGGARWAIEERMIRSIESVRAQAGITESEAVAAKGLPNLRDMCRDLGYPHDVYVGVQRMGSHAVHGTWSDLLAHYVQQEEDGSFRLQDPSESATHSGPLLLPTVLVLDSLRAHSTFLFGDSPHAGDHENDLVQVKEELRRASSLAGRDEFMPQSD